MIVNIGNKSIDEFRIALNKVVTKCPWCYLCFDIVESVKYTTNFNNKRNHLLVLEVYNVKGVVDYILKEYNWKLTKLSFDNFYTEKMMFQI
jgi:hypothetical protein